MIRRLLLPALAALALPALPAGAAPPDLDALLASGPSRELDAAFGDGLRRKSMRAAALAWGARGGLARRSWELARLLEDVAPQLDAVYRFDALLLRREGFLILPPAVAESRDAFRLARDGREASATGRTLRIVEPERLISAPPHWRDWLERRWAPATAPVSALFPATPAERAAWSGWVREGWAEGRRQADEILDASIDRLNAAFEGRVRWWLLETARMAEAPGLETSRSAVAGDGRQLRLDETTVRLGREVRLNPRPRDWRPLVLESPGAPR